MSTVVSHTLQLGTSSTAENNYTLAVPLNPDGSMTVTKGDRNGTQVMKFNANGSLILNKPLSIGAGSVSTTTTIDCSNSNRFTYDVPSGSHTFSFSNVPTGVFYDMILDINVTAPTPTSVRPTVVNLTTAVNNTKNGAAVVLTKPAGAQVGDFLLAVVCYDGGAATYTPASGFTEWLDPNNDSGPYLAYRVVTGTEGSSFTFASSGSAVAHNAAMLLIRNVKTTAGFGVSRNAGSDTTGTLGSVSANSLAVVIAANSASADATLAGADTQVSTGVGLECSLGIFTIPIDIIGTIGPYQWAAGTKTAQDTAFTIFEPASTPAGYATITWPGSITWQDGVTPPVHSTSNLRVSLSTYNGGTNWYGSFLPLGA